MLDYIVRKFDILFKNYPDFIVVYKPEGFRTHKVSENQWGFVETLSHHLKMPLWVVHRLDKDTSGVMLFAKNQTTAKELSELFEKHQIEKTYYFVTDQKNSKNSLEQNSLTQKSYIEKKDHIFVSDQQQTANSETQFIFEKEISKNKFLWKANPITGKPHQIRLHAQDLGMPILGDLEHGGSSYHRLGLHAGQIQFVYKNENYSFNSEFPPSFLSTNSELSDFLADSWHRLHQLLKPNSDQAYRLHHDLRNEMQIDIYGSTAWVYWYKEIPPTEQNIFAIHSFFKSKDLNCVVRYMKNRGLGVGGEEMTQLFLSENQKNIWTCFENDFQTELRTDAGFSPGLFLDQSENRRWVVEDSKNKNVLNLFSYTSAFSVCAGLGGAQQITTVDASTKFLEWSKSNFRLNSLDPDQHEFFTQDALLFLKGSQKRNRNWDLIICDPPSFGRTKNTVWKIEKDFPELIKLMWSCLSPKGTILFTCNYEKWTGVDLKKQIEKNLKGQKFKIQNLPPNTLDFDFYDEHQNLTKGFIIHKV